MRKLYFICYFLVALMVSCNKSSLTLNEEANLHQEGMSSETIPIDDAFAALNDVLAETSIKTRAATSTISKEDVFVIGRQSIAASTKSATSLDLPDTLLYAVNFPDGGFSIMAANTNLNSSVICVTDQGAVTLESFSSGYSFLESTNVMTRSTTESIDDEDKVFLDAGPDYLYSLLISSTVKDYFDAKTISDQQPETKESGVSSVGPLLETKWTQSAPFNKYKSPPGCVVIAVAQIMAFNEKPAISEFTTLSSSCTWTTLKNVYPSYNYSYSGSDFERNQAGLFANELGNSSNCDVDSSGGTTTKKAKSTLEKFGYDVTKRIGCGSGDIKKITQQLVNDKTPVYMDGCRKDNNTGEQKGHAWVIDGLSNNMFHINWGWHGDCDGYYAKGVFDTADVASYDANDPGYTYTGNDARDYYHYFRILLY